MLLESLLALLAVVVLEGCGRWLRLSLRWLRLGQAILLGLAGYFALAGNPQFDLLRQQGQALVILAFSVPLTLGSNQLSLGALLQVTVAAVLLFFAGRALQRWLKNRLLAPLGVDKGSQETISAVATYTLVGLGLVVLLQSAGIDLSSLTVFAGVLGIGIGFGLQNISSNFISGLTILIEQPIKVGDFVEVNELLGTVEQISFRSTIIETQDGISIIVPNSKFIENNVINWSYGNPSCRIRLPINVAENSDVTLVTEALLEAARQESRVMRDPSPQVWLKGFENDALNFELLVWIPQPQIKEPVRSSLNYFMEDSLRTYGIERSYNRQYIYLRDLGSLEALLPNRPNPVEIDHKASLRDLLRRVSFFHDFTEPQLRLLIEQGFQRHFAAEELVCRQGDPGNAFYIVLEGELAILTEPSGHRLAQIAAGSFCGEIALLTGTNRTATIQALVPTLLFVVDYKALQQLLSQHPDLAEQISQTLALRTRELRELGLLNEEENSRSLPVLQIRDRIRQLFGI